MDIIRVLFVSLLGFFLVRVKWLVSDHIVMGRFRFLTLFDARVIENTSSSLMIKPEPAVLGAIASHGGTDLEIVGGPR